MKKQIHITCVGTFPNRFDWAERRGLHVTILWFMGIENLRLTYHYKGRPENPTINEIEACRKIAG